MLCGGGYLVPPPHLSFAAFKSIVQALNPGIELIPNDANSVVNFLEDLVYLFGRAHFVYVKASAATEPELGVLNSFLRLRDPLGPVHLFHVKLVQVVSPFIMLQAHLLLQGSDLNFKVILLGLELLCQFLTDLVLACDFLFLPLFVFAFVPLSKALVPRVVAVTMSRMSPMNSPPRTFLAAGAAAAPVTLLTRPSSSTTSLQTL
mmetsp:Transcript_35387/g.56838  ORF Transcript_35387/g.56838 Transcript_35387/m.56838 type:complete len:204 (+) Transcript_35387:376-987(+)